MPGKVKVRILAGRNLPVMDRSSETSDAFVEIKFGNTTYKTDVYRKSLNPHWNSDWFKFEADDEELQDEPIQLRVMDYDTYSANDAIGKVFINLKPLLSRESAMICGWFPIFDTLNGIRGEVQVIVKLELFSDCNKFRSSSCGVKVFFAPGVPEGYIFQAIHGFVEELVVNDDPEYKWIDKIRTPRASNEARQLLLWNLAGEVQRKIGLKAIELGGNAIIGYQQNFDLEGESGIVLRCIGTAVYLVKDTSHANSIPNSPQYHKLKDEMCSSPVPATKSVHSYSPAKSLINNIPIFKNEAEFCAVPRTGSLSSSATSSAGIKPVIQHFTFNQDGGDLLEYPFITMKAFPENFIEHLGGIVSAKSVKLLDKDEQETRDCWWTEIRMEVRSHTKALGCNVVVGYTEKVATCDDVCILSAQGTAAIINPQVMCNSMPVFQSKEEKHEHGNFTGMVYQNKDGALNTSCKLCHIPYSENSVPFPATLTKCLICRQARVPDVLFTTIEVMGDNLVIGKGCLVQARVVRTKRDCKGETSAKEISDCLPFLEYELHRQLMTKLKLKGMNALFGMQMEISVGEKLFVAIATGTGVLLGALPSPKMPQLLSVKITNKKELLQIQENITRLIRNNRLIYGLNDAKELSNKIDTSSDVQLELDLAHGNKDAFVLEVDDGKDSEILSILNEHQFPMGFDICNLETIPGYKKINKSLQIFTRIWRAKFPSHDVSNDLLSKCFDDIIRTLSFKFRNISPCGLLNLNFKVDLPEEDDIQIVMNGMLVSLKDLPSDNDAGVVLKKSNQVIQSHGALRQEKSLSGTGGGIQLNRTLSVIHPSSFGQHVELTSLSYVPGSSVSDYLGNVSFCLIRECTDVREHGNLSGFIQSFLIEVQAIARAHVSALGGNALLSMKICESVLQHSVHKNQGQSLLFFSGDVVLIDYN